MLKTVAAGKFLLNVIINFIRQGSESHGKNIFGGGGQTENVSNFFLYSVSSVGDLLLPVFSPVCVPK